MIMALEQCHNRGFLYKASGMCNQAKHNMNMCLRAERLERTRGNHEKARAKRDKIAAVWKEIDENK